MRSSAVLAAGKIGEKGLIAQAIKDESSDVRSSAAAGKIGEKGLPILQQAIKDESEEVRFYAAEAAG